MASPTRLSSAQVAEVFRHQGNFLFEIPRYTEAIDAYTKAIELCPNVPIYWTNRALCHHHTNDWTKVEEDCRRAIQLDNNSIKAHRLLGLALLQRKDYKEAVKELEKALDLGKSMNLNDDMVEEILQRFSKAKYMEWEYESNQRSLALNTLKMECKKALRKKQVIEASLAEGFTGEHACVSKNKTRHLLGKIFRLLARMDCLNVLRVSNYQLLNTDSRDNINSPSNIASETSTFHDAEELEALDRVFKKAEEDDTPSTVPDYLCCKITLEILRDPVILPSGFTYDRSAIVEHLQKVGMFDPITRQRVTPSQLIPNLAIKEAVRNYLDKHGWAYQLD